MQGRQVLDQLNLSQSEAFVFVFLQCEFFEKDPDSLISLALMIRAFTITPTRLCTLGCFGSLWVLLPPLLFSDDCVVVN